jgi:hypothetical protein
MEYESSIGKPRTDEGIRKAIVARIVELGGSLAPTLRREEGTSFYRATGLNLSKVLFEMWEHAEIFKSKITFVPRGEIKKNEDGSLTVKVGGLEVIRRVNPAGEISEACFWVPNNSPLLDKPYGNCPEWVSRMDQRARDSKEGQSAWNNLLKNNGFIKKVEEPKAL